MIKKYPLDELSTALGRIMGLLLTEEKVGHAVQHLSRAVKDSIPGTLGAGVSILDSQARPVSSGSTDAIVKRADALQYELGQMANGQAIGAMKIYAASPGAFEDATTALMELFASPAATLLSHIQTAEIPERISESLPSALYSRDLINRACGILMERLKITEDVALQQLMREARATRSTLREVSATVLAGVASGPHKGSSDGLR